MIQTSAKNCFKHWGIKMTIEKKRHMWIYAYRDEETKIITFGHYHRFVDRIELPPLQEPWTYVIEWEDCYCDENEC